MPQAWEAPIGPTRAWR